MEIEIENRKVVIEEVGDRNNIPVIMVPAIGRPASDFRLLSEKLAENGYWALMFNPRGVKGSTGLDESLKIDDVARDVYLVLKKLGASKAHFIGNAFGTRVARMMAEKYPKIALSSTSITMGGFLAPQLPYPLLALDMIKNKENKKENFKDVIEEAYFSKGNDCSIWLDGWCTDVIPAYTLALTRTSIEELKSAGSAPMLIVQGEDDVFAPVLAGEIMKSKLKEQVRVENLPKAAHEILHEQPELLAKVIIKFLKDVDNNRFFNDSSSEKDHLKEIDKVIFNDKTLNHKILKRIENHNEFFKTYLKDKKVILDYGCGVGNTTTELAKSYGIEKVYGLDSSEALIKLAKEKATENIEFIKSDIYKLPFSDNFFDAVWVNERILYLENPVKLLREAYRVLKDGGVIGINSMDFDSNITTVDSEIINETINDIENALKEKGYNIRQGKYNAHLLDRAGFKKIVSKAEVECYSSVEDKENLASFMVDIKESLGEHDNLDDVKKAWKVWIEESWSFFSIANCRAIGWKESKEE